MYTDCHAGYNTLNQRGFIHFSNNHQLGFYDPWNESHTNTVEGLNNILRAFLAKNKGIKKDRLQYHLDEFVLRRNFALDSRGLFNKICLIIGSMQNQL